MTRVEGGEGSALLGLLEAVEDKAFRALSSWSVLGGDEAGSGRGELRMEASGDVAMSLALPPAGLVCPFHFHAIGTEAGVSETASEATGVDGAQLRCAWSLTTEPRKDGSTAAAAATLLVTDGPPAGAGAAPREVLLALSLRRRPDRPAPGWFGRYFGPYAQAGGFLLLIVTQIAAKVWIKGARNLAPGAKRGTARGTPIAREAMAEMLKAVKAIPAREPAGEAAGSGGGAGGGEGAGLKEE